MMPGARSIRPSTLRGLSLANLAKNRTRSKLSCESSFQIGTAAPWFVQSSMRRRYSNSRPWQLMSCARNSFNNHKLSAIRSSTVWSLRRWMVKILTALFGWSWPSSTWTPLMMAPCHQLRVVGLTSASKKLSNSLPRRKQTSPKKSKASSYLRSTREMWNSASNSTQKNSSSSWKRKLPAITRTANQISTTTSRSNTSR